MTGATTRAALALVAVALVLVASTARAATSLKTTSSSPRAEVGQGVRIELGVLTSGEDDPNSPRLTLPPGFSVQGPNVSSSRQISFTNGQFESRHGITATWIVAGSRPGKFLVGPATVKVGAALLQGETIEIEVVPKGTLPQPPPKRRGFFDPNDPLDPFSFFKRPPGAPDLDDLPLLDTLPEPPAELVIPEAPDATAFLRATIEPARSVVGQQVTLRVYAYGARGAFEEVASSEPSRPDFLSYPIVESSYRQRRYTVPIQSGQWQAVKIREVALFSLHAGSLPIGSMKMSFRGRGYPDSAPSGGLPRESPALTAIVTEPPVQGRPPGYELGTVGSYALTAEVEPRRIEAGSAVSVILRVEGTGNVPRRVKLPERPGVEWMEPAFSEAIVPNAGVIGGWRQLRHVVRIDQPGTVDLGEVTLPYFDPSRGRYEIARARLGEIEVTPVAAPVPAPGGSAVPTKVNVNVAEEKDPFAALAPPRTALSALTPPATPWTDHRLFWLSILGAPLLVVLAYAAQILRRKVGDSLAARRQRVEAQVERALQDAVTGAARSDRAKVAASVERALYLTIEDRLGLRARAVLRSALRSELARLGVTEALAEQLTRVLDACDALRFGGGDDASRALLGEAERVIRSLLATPRRVNVRPREDGAP